MTTASASGAVAVAPGTLLSEIVGTRRMQVNSAHHQAALAVGPGIAISARAPDGVIEARYEAVATGTQRLPFLWSACLLLPLDAQTRLRMPEATRFRVQTVAGVEADPPVPAAPQWPRLPLRGCVYDLANPWQLPRAAMVTGWLDLAGSRSGARF